MPHTLVVVSEYPLLLESIRAALASSPEFAVVGEAASGADALSILAEHPGSVLVVATHDPISILEEVRDCFPAVKAIVFDDSATPATARLAMTHGAKGFVASTVEPAAFASALRQILEGTAFHVVGIGPAVLGLDEGELTDRELQVLTAVAEGLSNIAIARRFAVTEQTVKLHLTRVYRKLHVNNRTEAARWLFEHGYEPEVRERR